MKYRVMRVGRQTLDACTLRYSDFRKGDAAILRDDRGASGVAPKTAGIGPCASDGRQDARVLSDQPERQFPPPLRRPHVRLGERHDRPPLCSGDECSRAVNCRAADGRGDADLPISTS